MCIKTRSGPEGGKWGCRDSLESYSTTRIPNRSVMPGRLLKIFPLGYLMSFGVHGTLRRTGRCRSTPPPKGRATDLWKPAVREDHPPGAMPQSGRLSGHAGNRKFFLERTPLKPRRPQKTVSRSTACVRTHLCMPGELSDRWHAPRACAPPNWERRTGCFSEIRSRDLTTSCSAPCWPTAAPTDWNPKPWSSQPVKGDANEFLGIQAGRAVVVHHHAREYLQISSQQFFVGTLHAL